VLQLLGELLGPGEQLIGARPIDEDQHADGGALEALVKGPTLCRDVRRGPGCVEHLVEPTESLERPEQ
jgi:hypothetical protein